MFGSFMQVPCRQGGVRIIRPEIPHGSTSNNGLRRRIILPWYVGVNDDGNTLDNVESDTWADIAFAYTMQTGVGQQI